MKNILITILTMVISFGATAQQKKALVAYFSATGTTESVAKQIAEAAKADIYEIKPTVKYSSADLDWHDKNSRSSVEMNDKKSRPEMDGNVSNISQYDTIYIGFPIWWYVAPHIINTFIESNDLSGKTIIPFATSGGSSIKGSVKAFREDYPNLNFNDGMLLNNPKKNDIEKFLK